MESFWSSFFGNKMPPHGHCYLWDDRLVSLHVVTDAIIVLSYFTIPLALVYLVKRRDDLQFNYIFILFAVFIFACGATHLVNIYNVWYGAYWFSGTVKAVTALASIGTAILVWPLIPRALAIPSNSQLQSLNDDLREKAARNAQQARELEALSARLEEQVEHRTVELANAKYLLEVNNRALEVSNRELEQYADITAHDLREPLKKIRAQAQLLGSRLGPEADSDARRGADDIARTCERMTNLIDSLLSYARIESVTLPESDTDTNQVLEDVLSDFGLEIRKREITVIHNTLPALPVADYHLQQILLNLVSNALRFSGAKEAPVIEIGPLRPADGQRIGFHVRDNGSGIAQEQHKNIFECAERNDQQHSGIGLAICKKIVDQYKGSIELESREGEGANFKVYFPARSAS
ncbi:ATP-binding protein [Litorivivens sp.]|uniref:sensor histidine kinase n=1 Tax=Litorivivens sp. TaxID=2020868 RepID=UPI00356A6C84